MDNHSLHIQFIDFNVLITMFSDKINQIPLCISTAQTMNSLFSESNFHSPLRTSRLKSLVVNCQQEFPLTMASG